MAASPLSASRGKVRSLSQRAAFGRGCSFAKRRTAWRITSAGADIGKGVMAEEVALPAVTLGDAVDAPATHFQDARGAVDVLALGGREESGVELRGQRVVLHADARLDGEPHRAVGRRHQCRAVDDAPRPLEIGLVRQLERALLVVRGDDLEAPGPQEPRSVEQVLKFFYQINSRPIAVASPPPMHRLATPRLPPRFRSAPISVTRIRAPEAPIGWPSAHAPPCTFTLSCGSPCSFIAAMATTAKASLIS